MLKGDDWPIIGYLDRFSVAPGGNLKVMVSTRVKSFSASVVRLGGPRPEPVEVIGSGIYVGRSQTAHAGSYVNVPHSQVFDHMPALSIHAWIYPTLTGAGHLQGLVTKWSTGRGWGLYLDESGKLLFKVTAEPGRSGEFRSEYPLRARNWYEVSCSYDGRTRRVRMAYEALGPWAEAQTSI